jgi:hypothetical protein
MSEIEKHIEGSQKLTGIFGYWPSFHDAEIIELHLRHDDNSEQNYPPFPVLTTKIHLWELTNEIDAQGYYVLRHHTLVTLRFHDVLDLKINGFTSQNVIFGLSIAPEERAEGPWKTVFAVEFEPVAEFEAVFKCSRIEVLDAIPWTQAG